jgi:hypothetical protein
VPAAYELLQKYGLSSAQDAIQLSRDERMPEWGTRERQLARILESARLSTGSASDVFALSLTFSQPPTQDIIQKYFQQKGTPTARIQ